MAKELASFPGEYQINVNINNGNVNTTGKIETPSDGYVNDKLLSQVIKSMQGIGGVIDKIKGTGADSKDLNLEGIQQNIKNFSGSKEERNSIVKEVRQIISSLRATGNESAKSASDELLEALEMLKDVSMRMSQEQNGKSKKIAVQNGNTKKIDRSFERAPQENKSNIGSNNSHVDKTKPSLTKVHGEEFITKNGERIKAGERLSVGGTPLGTYEKQYEKYQKNYEEAYTRRKGLLKEAGAKNPKELEKKIQESPNDQNLNNLNQKVQSANEQMQKWMKASEDLVNQVVKIFENSPGELQKEFLGKLRSQNNISPNSEAVAQAAGKPLNEIPEESRKSIARILEKSQKEKFDYAEGTHRSPLKEALHQKLKDYEYDFGLDANDQELNYGGAKQPWEIEEERVKEERKKQNDKQTQRKEEEYVLQSSLGALRSDDFKKILDKKDGTQIATNLIQQMANGFENGNVNLNERSLSENYNEFVARKENEGDPLQENTSESTAFRFREGVKGIMQELSGNPKYAEKANIITSKLGMSGIERGKRATTVEEDEKQAYQRISNLLTFSDTVDKAWEGISKKRGVSIDEIREDAFKDENFKSRYEESEKARKIWNEMGGPSNPSATLGKLFGVPKEKSELYKQMPTKEVDNIFSVLSRLSKTGSIKTYKNGELVESTSGGIQAVIDKAVQRMSIGASSPDKIGAKDFYRQNEYRGLELDESKKYAYSPAERTALFHKAGQLTYEVGATNLSQAKKNAQSLLDEEVQRINGNLKEGESFVDSPKSLRLRNVISEIDSLKKSEDELYGVTKKSNIPLTPNEKIAGQQIKKIEESNENKTAQNIKSEAGAIEENNKATNIHEEKMKKASVAEKEKMLISSDLAKKLKEETQALNNENTALDNHTNSLNKATKSTENLEKATIEYEPGEFLGPTKEDPNRHTYRSKKTGKIVDFTATEIAGLAFPGAGTGQSKEDFKKISKALNDAYITGSDFSAESLGILDKNTGKIDQKQWDFIKKGQESTLKGTMLHKVAELGTKYQTDSIDDLEGKLVGKDKIEYNDLFDATSKKIGILGSEFNKSNMQSFLSAYMDTMFPKNQDGKRNIQKPIYSESPMVAKISKGDKSYTVGMSPDEIFLNDWLMATDIKTGKINSEKNSFQLALNARTFQEGAKKGAIPNVSTDAAKKDLELSILHYAEGAVTKIVYGLMPDNEIFDVVDTAAKGKSYSAEDRKKFNYESSIGRKTSTSQSVESAVMSNASSDDREIYKAMLGDIKKIQQAKKQIAVLDVAIQKSSGDVQANLIKQKEAQEKIVKEAENSYNISKSQVQLDKTKNQILENERQRDQRTTLTDAEIEAAAETERQKAKKQVVNEAMKNYKTSNKAVFDQEVEVARAQNKLQNYKGDSELERKALETNLKNQQEILYNLQQQQAVLNGRTLTYRNELGQIQEIELTEEQINRLKQTGNQLELDRNKKLSKVNASIKESRSLFDQLANGLKRSFTNLIDYSLAGMAIGKIRQTFTQAITYAKELDIALTNLQIAAGTTREETTAMLREYNNLAKELGRTTQEVATASNDWLRAGYLGEEAAQLTEASMQLSTLGMIDAASATTNLISVMKGWQLEAEEVGNVVDKLTVIICGVCRVIGIGHESKCR